MLRLSGREEAPEGLPGRVEDRHQQVGPRGKPDEGVREGIREERRKAVNETGNISLAYGCTLG